MSSYYERVIGNLSSSEIARSEDIHEIQTNIQSAFQDMIKDTFGEGCILDEDEEALKLTPTPYHVDQENDNFDEEDCLISFYDRYFRQKITTERSEIQSIKIQMRNDSNIEPTIFAEIRDSDMNLLKEANTKLSSTINKETPIDVVFNFNLTHLPIGDYYFVIRPVDISSTDLSTNGDETPYDIIGPEYFLVKYDRSGCYQEELQASYNGVDYLNANLLDDQVETYDDGIVEANETNYDLCFEQIYSSGNTYLITPGACMVMGQKTYPIDTHVTIDGPSKNGDRIDLVTLTNDGLLHVTEGVPFTGKKTEANYPVNTSGFKIAYITTYHNSADVWTCPNCGEMNDGNSPSCVACDTTTNNKIPLIEQDDDNGITRQRDVLERLRRLEKKMDYQIENNSPSRVKYVCTVDPTLAVKGKYLKGSTMLIPEDEIHEGSYGLSTETNENGETVVTFNPNLKETYTWSIIKKITTTKTTKKNTIIKLEANDIPHLPVKKPKKTYTSQYLNITISEKIYRTVTVKEKSGKTTDKESTQAYWNARANVPVDVYIKTKKKKKTKVKFTNKKTNSKGKIQISLWGHDLAAGSYYIEIKCHGHTLQRTLEVKKEDGHGKGDLDKEITFTISESSTSSPTTNINSGTIAGNDSFAQDNVVVDPDVGEVYLKPKAVKKDDKKLWSNITKAQRNKLKYSNQSYVIQSSTTSQQSTYAMLSLYIKSPCTIYSITPYIKSFTNIKKFKIVLFENDKVFNLNTTKNSYVKQIATSKAKNTNFSNLYESGWIDAPKKIKTQHTFNDKDLKKGIELKEGTYSIVILGTLKDKKKDGKITIKQYHTSNATTYGGVSKVKGTYNPTKIFIEKNSLVNRTFLVKMDRVVHKHSNTGTLVSKTITAKNSIKTCVARPNFEIPAGCDVELSVSNNGGKTYIPMNNNTNQVNFVGLGRDFKWKVVFSGTSSTGPKLKFNAKKKYAIQFDLLEQQSYMPYEDYGRCFSTPILNAHWITRSLVQNSQVKNRFEEWEYCRLWMEDEDLGATIDICFSYDDNSTITTETKQADWGGKNVFFSQTLSNLTVADFSQNSIDYSNYNADVEYDENNFRLKYDTNAYNSGQTIITTPYPAEDTLLYDYNYGDITTEDYDMSNFDYGLMSVSTTYYDNTDSSQTKYSGVHLKTGPYYQALYKPQTDENIIDTTTQDSDEPTTIPVEESTPTNNSEPENNATPAATNDNLDICWAKDSDPDYVQDGCIIGVSFNNGLKMENQYTSLTIDLFANLRDCKETEKGADVGEINYAVEGSEGQAVLDQNKAGKNDTKYINSDNFYYIPKNTLELVVSLNPYGLIEDDNATYGKAYPIDVDLVSCKHTPFSINLSDLYGSTVYSFGIRVKDDVTWQQETDPNDNTKKIQKHPSLHNGDILGIGNIYFNGYNIYPYAPYIYTGNTNRQQWKKINEEIKSLVTPTDNILDFDLNTEDQLGALFYNDKLNINLVPYNWIDVQYKVIEGSIMKGEVILDFYDTTEYWSTQPVESLPLPAWGRVQSSYTGSDNVVHAWFKIHTDATKIKAVVLRRESPTGRSFDRTQLRINNILFLNTESVPALGAQMQVRIYPKDEKALANTKIRKFGCVYRLG